jgi:hypothetical protein
MAAAKKKPAELDGEALSRLVDALTAQIRQQGAVARSSIAAPKASIRALLDRLAARGLEARPRFVRVPLTSQLDALLARGPVAVKGIEKQLAGGATRAEARAALTRLVKEGRAFVRHGAGKDGVAARPSDDALEAPDRARVAALAKALAALAKAPGKSALAPRARWEDVRELIDDVLGDDVPRDDVLGDDVPRDDVLGDDVPGDDVPGDDVPGDDGPGDDGPGDDRPRDTAAAPVAAAPTSSLLDTLRRSADESGVSAVADAARLLDPPLEAPQLATALRELAARGAVELRIASQPHLLTAEDRALCPTDPAGRVLAYARVLGG